MESKSESEASFKTGTSYYFYYMNLYIYFFYLNVYVVVQFHPWFNFSHCFKLIIVRTLPNPKTKEDKFKQRIKLNHNIIIYMIILQ